MLPRTRNLNNSKRLLRQIVVHSQKWSRPGHESRPPARRPGGTLVATLNCQSHDACQVQWLIHAAARPSLDDQALLYGRMAGGADEDSDDEVLNMF